MRTAVELPAHYLVMIRRLIRFAVVFMVVGMLFGILSTEVQKKFRYTARWDAPPRLLSPDDPAAEGKAVEVPPGMMWESGFDLRISHGHFILIGGVIPLCVAATLFLLHLCGGRPMSRGLLEAFFWLYAVGAAAALTLIFYKGWVSMQAVKAGEFDLAAVNRGMFGGSRVVRALAHAISHTVLAAGLFVIAWGLWKSAGTLKPARPDAGAEAKDTEPGA